MAIDRFPITIRARLTVADMDRILSALEADTDPSLEIENLILYLSRVRETLIKRQRYKK